jgi:hypothetical protein
MRSRTTTAAPRALGRARGRRRAVRVALATLAVLALQFGGSPASADEHYTGVLPEGDWPDPAADWAIDFIERAEQELPAFNDTARLEELGFVNVGVTAPGGYDHWTNVSWMMDEHILDPQYPESLVFQRTADGGYEVQAAMFFLSPETTMETIPSLISWLPGWHTHPELCSDDEGRIVGTPGPDGTCANGDPVLAPMMHAWIVDNDCGHRFGGIDAGGLHCDYEHDHA